MNAATLAQGQQVLNLIAKKMVSVERLQALIESGILADLLGAPFEGVEQKKVEGFRASFSERVNDALYELIVPKRCPIGRVSCATDYNLRADECSRAGNYDEVSPTISCLGDEVGAYRLRGEDVEFVLSKKEMTLWRAESMIPAGFLPICVHKLLVLGNRYPHIQKVRRVVALGSRGQDSLKREVCATLVSRQGSYRKVGITAEVLKNDLIAVMPG